MLKYFYASDFARHEELANSMFLDRASQFHDRQGWDVQLDARGWERDEYDEMNPLYVAWETAPGVHGGSMRFLPTTGAHMCADKFNHLTGNIRIESPLIWECTRFCLAPQADSHATAALVLAAGEIMEHFHLSHFIGVFDGRMTRIYRRYGVAPDVIGEKGEGKDKLSVGLWEMKRDAWAPILKAVGVPRATSRRWLEQSLAVKPKPLSLLRTG